MDLPGFRRKRDYELDDESVDASSRVDRRRIMHRRERDGSSDSMDAIVSKRWRKRVGRRSIRFLIGPVLAIGLTVGCAGEQRVERVRIANETFGRMTVAVAPAINLSGAADFDPNQKRVG